MQMKDVEFEKIEDASRLKKEELDKVDYNHAIADLNVGRQERHLPSNLSARARIKKEQEERQITLSLLDEMLKDPEYAALYHETKSLIDNAMVIAEEELENANIKLEALTKRRDELLDNSNRLADGTVVFKNKDGDVVTKDNEVITDQVLLDGIVWKDGATTYEEYADNDNEIGKTLESIDAITTYQVEVLGEAKEKIENEDEPPTEEEIKDIKKDVVEQAPDSIKKRLEVSETTSDHTQSLSNEISILKM